MERLTIKPCICAMASTDYCESQEDCYQCDHGKKMRQRLAAYEDTGLTPEQVSHITGSCKGCIWKNRYQKCSCCARNKHMKDNYQSEGKNE